MRIEGQLLDVVQNSGTFTDRQSGDQVNWSNVTVSIFDGREVVKIKVKGDEAAHAALALLPSKGSTVAVEVESPREISTRSFIGQARPVRAAAAS